MDKAGAKKRLTAIFLQELQERTGHIERDLLALDQSTDRAERGPRLQSLLRSSHSLKGASGLVELKSIEAVCHRMEDLLIAARDGHLDLDGTTIQLMLSANDALALAGRELAAGRPLATNRLDSVRSQLSALIRDSVSGPRSSRATDKPAPAPVDVSESEPALEPDDLSSDDKPPVVAEAYARVPAAKLDTLLRQSGELVIARSRSKLRIDQLSALQELLRSGVVRSRGRRVSGFALSPANERRSNKGRDASVPDQQNLLLKELARGLQDLCSGLSGDRRTIEQAATALDREVRRARLQPFAAACAGLDRLVRDLAIESGKEVSLKVTGGETEIDRSVAQELQDVLGHLVRNAVDHGIEPAEERRVAGKPRRGTIAISAALTGDRLTIQVSDDGRGLKIEAIQEQARRDRSPSGEEEDPLRQIFLPGLSTSPQVTTTSGRGIGLDIVKSLVESMRGAVHVSHKPGLGTNFTLTVPTRLGTIRALLLKAGDHIVAIDTSSVDRVIRASPEHIHVAAGRMLVATGSTQAPALDLRDWLGMASAEPARGRRPAVLLNEIGRSAAILVDSVLAEQELLVRGLGPRLQNLREHSGGTILPDGTIALVLNSASLGEAALKGRPARSATADEATRTRRRILVADDSLTTRTLEKTILEEAGYDVAAVADGELAWQMLQKNGADLVLADVDMPGLDGFALTETIRRSAQFRNVPVILLTARQKAEDRQRGLEAGADAYLVKSAFDQRELLKTIAELT